MMMAWILIITIVMRKITTENLCEICVVCTNVGKVGQILLMGLLEYQELISQTKSVFFSSSLSHKIPSSFIIGSHY